VIVGLGGLGRFFLGSDAPKNSSSTAAAIYLSVLGFQFLIVLVAGFRSSWRSRDRSFSVLWIVGVINAVNFIDGIDRSHVGWDHDRRGVRVIAIIRQSFSM